MLVGPAIGPELKRALKANLVTPDRFIGPLDDSRFPQNVKRAEAPEKFEELLDLIDAKIQGLFGDIRPDCILVCLPDETADLRVQTPVLSLSFAEKVGQIMTELPDNRFPNPSYRFYM